MNHTTDTDSVTLALLCSEDSLSAFCRRLACAVNQGPMHLARAFAVATQIYPARVDSLLGEATVLNCEFRMRQAGTSVDAGAVADLRRRLIGFDLLEHQFVPPLVQVRAPSPALAAS